jgi:cell division protein FtsW
MRPVGTVTVLLCALLLAERDLGSAIGLAIVAGAVLVVSGTRGSVLFRLGLGTLALGALAIGAESFRRARFLAFLDPWKDPLNNGYQLVQSQQALGHGGLFGVGLGQGIEKSFSLPEAHTDMIFATIGEELGLVGVVCLLAAFAAVAWAGFTIARSARDPFGKRLAASLTALVVGQAIVNVGGVVSILPLTGVPLPLVSYGGTSLIATLAALGLVLSVAANGGSAARSAPREQPEGARPRPSARARPRAAAGRRSA